jgi:hypothetical protein
MATRRSHRHSSQTADQPTADETPDATEEATAAGHQVNGETGDSAQPSAGAGTQPVMERAAEAADRLAENVRHYASIIGMKILRFAARVREEAEDIWAEAQSIRRGGPPPEA